ncbi:MAG: NAD/NADP octopine/nopaline dehydrogenase family protein [Clostridiaceae bacterium]|nr:NAD/NADP octopine/nopaline dehydrogenase family protein [Clostridiaceae bacterium]
MLNIRKIAVISTGNGGQSMAAYLAHKGYSVSLYAREEERVKMFRDNRFVLHGEVEAEAAVEMISCNMTEVIQDASVILVTTPAQYHSVVASHMAGCLQDGQMVVLNPGRTFGTYEFDRTLRRLGCRARVLLGETDTFVFTCRCREPGHPHIYGIKHNLLVAGHLPDDTEHIRTRMAELFGEAVAAESVLHTGLSNIGMLFHPLPILMNITRVEAKEEFLYYKEGISPMTADILTRMDTERMAVANALGIRVPTVMEWLADHYGSAGDTLYARIQNTKAYQNVLAPTDVDTRYIFEDIQTGCVPVSCLGKHLGVPTPIIDSVISWASSVYGRDFMVTGRNGERIDLDAVCGKAEILPA